MSSMAAGPAVLAQDDGPDEHQCWPVMAGFADPGYQRNVTHWGMDYMPDDGVVTNPFLEGTVVYAGAFGGPSHGTVDVDDQSTPVNVNFGAIVQLHIPDDGIEIDYPIIAQNASLVTWRNQVAQYIYGDGKSDASIVLKDGVLDDIIRREENPGDQSVTFTVLQNEIQLDNGQTYVIPYPIGTEMVGYPDGDRLFAFEGRDGQQIEVFLDASHPENSTTTLFGGSVLVRYWHMEPSVTAGELVGAGDELGVIIPFASTTQQAIATHVDMGIMVAAGPGRMEDVWHEVGPDFWPDARLYQPVLGDPLTFADPIAVTDAAVEVGIIPDPLRLCR